MEHAFKEGLGCPFYVVDQQGGAWGGMIMAGKGSCCLIHRTAPALWELEAGLS